MTNASTLFRSLIIYSICLPLALVVGYLLATSMTDYSSIVAMGIILAILTVPLFLRWHYPWMIATWNTGAVLFFLPGKPGVSMLTLLASFTISVLQYILNRRMKFISVPAVAKPLLFLLLVVLVTARFTGGIGLNSLGSQNVGGKRYVAFFLGIIGYFALTAVRIPPEKRKLYIFLFFGGGLTLVIGNLAYVMAPGLSFIFLVFPTDLAGLNALTDNAFAAESSITRLGGLSNASISFISLMLAFYGIRGFLDSRKWWRLPLLLLCIAATFFGGFRSHIIIISLTLGILFYMEGLARTQALPVVVLALILVTAIAVPSVRKLPLNVQRSLAFLPIDIDPIAANNAAGSTEWRVLMWEEVLPLVPQYLLLGKGLAINSADLEAQRDRMTATEGQYYGAMLAGDYHNGPLSLIIPFGLFGTAGFIWFLAAGAKVLYRNYKYGDADLLIANRFFLASFVVKIIIFFLIFGSFYNDLGVFASIVGFSIALNRGVAAPAAAAVARPVFNRFKVAANAAR